LSVKRFELFTDDKRFATRVSGTSRFGDAYSFEQNPELIDEQLQVSSSEHFGDETAAIAQNACVDPKRLTVLSKNAVEVSSSSDSDDDD
jgi:hypothetical protein